MTPLYCPPFIPMADVLPDIQRGEWSLKTFEVTASEVEFQQLKARASGDRHRATVWYDLQPGRYKVLKNTREVVMSDTPFERRTNRDAFERARGRVLIHGLGIGMLPLAVLRNQVQLEHLTIVELSADVISMVEPMLQIQPETGGRLTIHQGNAFMPQDIPALRGQQFDFIYSDIWPHISADNWPDVVALRRLWRPYRAPRSKHTAWVEGQVKSDARRHGITASSTEVSRRITQAQLGADHVTFTSDLDAYEGVHP